MRPDERKAIEWAVERLRLWTWQDATSGFKGITATDARKIADKLEALLTPDTRDEGPPPHRSGKWVCARCDGAGRIHYAGSWTRTEECLLCKGEGNLPYPTAVKRGLVVTYSLADAGSEDGLVRVDAETSEESRRSPGSADALAKDSPNLSGRAISEEGAGRPVDAPGETPGAVVLVLTDDQAKDVRTKLRRCHYEPCTAGACVAVDQINAALHTDGGINV